MELPEKQGLKQKKNKKNMRVGAVAVELPEKQGLKPSLKDIKGSEIISCSGTSRKTRIETHFLNLFIRVVTVLQWNFQKNKD